MLQHSVQLLEPRFWFCSQLLVQLRETYWKVHFRHNMFYYAGLKIRVSDDDAHRHDTDHSPHTNLCLMKTQHT